MENHIKVEAQNGDGAAHERCAPTPEELNKFRHAVQKIVGKWKIDIMWVLLGGPMRFGELRRTLPGITQHMLTAQLRALEADGLVRRVVYAEVPPRVEYGLTHHADALKPVFLAIVDWSHSQEPETRPG